MTPRKRQETDPASPATSPTTPSKTGPNSTLDRFWRQPQSIPEQPKPGSPDTSFAAGELSDRARQEQADHDFALELQRQQQQDQKPEPSPKALPKPGRLQFSMEQNTNSHEENFEIPFNTSILKFQPEDYQYIKARFKNGRAPYQLLSHCFALINSTRSRISIVDTLTNLLRTLVLTDPESLLPAVWLATNSIAPSYQDKELNLGPSIFSKAVKNVSGAQPAKLKALWDKYGDPGDVAFEAQVSVRTLAKMERLGIHQVFQLLCKIEAAKGSGAQESKQRIVERLLMAGKGEEIRFLARTVMRHLRIGAVKTTMLIALSRAFSLTKPHDSTWDLPPIDLHSKETSKDGFKRSEEIVKQCFARRPNYNDIVPALLELGIQALPVHFGITVGIPIKPMLGTITRDIGDMLLRVQDRDFSCEYKYDGQRAQFHCDSQGNVKIFSRHLEDMTTKYPDLIAIVPQIRGDNVQSFIMEGEVVAVDPDSGNLQTFQTLSNRGRKNVEIGNVKVNVCVYAFDLMYLNGESLLDRTFRERRDLLRSLFVKIPNRFAFVESIDTRDQEEIDQFFKGATTTKCEGIMVKLLDNPPATDPSALPSETKTRRKPLLSTYEPDRRADSWLKVKKDYNAGSDSLDLIPVGAWHGQGRKAGWYSPILLAVRDEDSGCLQAVCKCISGFTDTFYKELNVRYALDSGHCSRDKTHSYIESALIPDVWFEPREVWEIRGADITLSPVYGAALGLISEERGLSIRFPRFMRLRDDKSVEEASTSADIAAMYRNQEQGRDTNPPTEAADDEIDI